MLVSDLVFECSRAMGLDDTNPGDEYTLMLQWINRGIIELLTQTKCYVQEGSMAMTAGVTDYRIDSNVLAVRNITVQDSAGNPLPVQIINMEDLLPYLSNLIATTVSPMYASMDGDFMRVAPPPSSAINLTYFYVPRPTPVSAGANDPSTATYGGIRPEYHDAILAFMKWKAAEYDQQGGGFYRGHAYAPGAAFEAIWKDELDRVKRKMKQLGQRGISQAKIGYPDRGRFPQRNDVYPAYNR